MLPRTINQRRKSSTQAVRGLRAQDLRAILCCVLRSYVPRRTSGRPQQQTPRLLASTSTSAICCPPPGLVGCFILCLVVSSLETFTMYVLAKFSERYDASSYGNLIRRALGKKTAAALSAVMVVYLWGSCMAYLVRDKGAGSLLFDGVSWIDSMVWWLLH